MVSLGIYAFAQFVGIGGGVGSWPLGAGCTVPTGAPQKTMGTPFRGWSLLLGPKGAPGCVGKNGAVAVGHGPSAGLEGIPAVGFTKLAKSTRQFRPGMTMRMGVKPGQMTKLLM